jgi:hypothetical protein
MGGIVDADAFLFGANFALEIAGDPLEFRDHALDLSDPSALLVNLKLLQANERLA